MNQDVWETYVGALERFITPEVNETEKRQKGEYPYIALDFDLFEEEIKVLDGIVKRYPGDKAKAFVDVGCGIGSKVVLAAQILPPDEYKEGKRYVLIVGE